MKLLADVNVAPRTVAFLRTLGHDVVRVTDVLDATSSDQRIVEFEERDHAFAVITRWMERYHTERPHSALGDLTPAEYRERIAP